MLEQRTADFNQAILDTVACLIIVVNPQGQIVRFNKECENTTGYSFEEVKNHYFWDFLLVAEEICALKAAFEKVQAGSFPNTFEGYWLTRSGERRLISWSNTALLGENHQVEYVIGTGIDITQRKQLEEKLQEERDFAQLILNSIGQGVTVIDEQGRFTYVNPAYAQMVGYDNNQQLIGKTPFDLTSPAGHTTLQEAWNRRHLGEISSYETDLISKDGQTTNSVLINGVPYYKNGQWAGSISVISNITELKKAQELARQNHALLKAVIEGTSDAVFIKDCDERFILINQVFASIANKPVEEIIGRTALDIWPTDAARQFQVQDRKVLNTGLPQTFEFTVPISPGQVRTYLSTRDPYRDSQGNIIGIFGLARDITERKRAEEQLRESEERFRLLVEDIEDYSILMLDPNGKVVSWNRGAEKIKGYPAEEIIGRSIEKFYPPEDLALGIPAQILASARTIGHYSGEGWRVRRDGSRFWASIVVTALYHEQTGELRGFAKVTRDITKYKLAQDALLESEARFSRLFQSAPMPIALTRLKDGVCLDLNTNFTHLTGFSREEAVGRTSNELIKLDPNQRERLIALVLDQGFARNFEGQIYNKKGEMLEVIASSEVIEVNGEKCLLSTFYDISERKNAERQLKKWADIFHNINLGIVVADSTGQTMQMVNEALVRLLGYEKVEDLVGQSPLMAYSSEFKKQLPHLLQVAQQQDYYVFEPVLLRKDGTTFPAQVAATMVRDEEGQLLYRIVSVQDITARRQAEEALKKSEELYRTLVQNIPDSSVLLFDHNLRYLLADGAALPKYGYTKEYMEGKTLWEAVSPESVAELEPIYRAALAGTTTKFERTYQESTYYSQAIPVKNPKGEIFAGLLMIQDISERKAAEEQIRAALMEKEVLLKEIHHRVKNNLQVVSSLLKLQASYIKDPYEREMLKESQNRVHSMALVHEKLYKSKDLSEINIGEYLEELVSYLYRLYISTASSASLKLVVEKPLKLNLDKAILCGLIVNELISNSFKHAFADPKHSSPTQPEINLVLALNANNMVSLIVKDNGKGLPPGFDFQKGQSLGLKLVHTLVKQLEGTIELKSGLEGTEFVLTFPFTQTNEPAIISKA